MDIKNRIKQIRTHYCEGNNEMFAQMLGEQPNTVSNWANRGLNNISVLMKLSDTFKDLNLDWLITGSGEMLKSDNKQIKIFVPEDLPKQVGKLYKAPIYESYPVSAGMLGMANVVEEEPNGYAYTTMPGVTFFPVIGCSFEPEIYAGSYIGTVKVNKWDRFDPDKIYFILTKEERMLKRLRIDPDRDDILWCVSPNLQEFSILKDEITEISHVFFYGKMI